MKRIRVAVLGAGSFGRNHLRVLRDCPRAELVAVVDPEGGRAAAAAAEFGCRPLEDWRQLPGKVDAAIVAVPTSGHAEAGCCLLEAGIDVLVEKPIAADRASARRLVDTARAGRRILQVGHLERFNPAVVALQCILRLPLFFEIHRLSEFTPRSLDVDVVLDLMVHDIDLVLAMTGKMPEEIRAAGISILTDRVDIANVRLSFPGGCVANLTASRVSTERVRKFRLFQPHQYISLDYTRQDAVVQEVTAGRRISLRSLPVNKGEPLRLELEAFLECVAERAEPLVSGEDALRALDVSLAIVDRIEEHARLVASHLSNL